MAAAAHELSDSATSRPGPTPSGTGPRRGRRARRRLAPGPVVAGLAGALCVMVGVGLLLAPAPSGASVVELGAQAETAEPGARTAAGPPAGVETRAPRPAGITPTTLALPGREVAAPVVPVVTGRDGAMVVPPEPSTVGWWSPSALAGSGAGTTVLAGHVDSAEHGLGALAALRDVTVGESVVLGGGARDVAYRVTARRQYEKADLPAEVFAVGGPPRLVMITCGGEFDPVTRHYADNVVVFAEPVGD